MSITPSATPSARRTARPLPLLALIAVMALTCSCSTELLATYLVDTSHTNAHPTSPITAANAASLRLRWTATGGQGSSAQPAVWNGVAYWGDWLGREHATSLDGQERWSTDLGTTAGCFPPSAGVSSSATVARVDGRELVLVGGGDATMYALDATSGAIVWSTRLGTSPDHFIWGSPSMYRGNVYIGVASYGACPMVQGSLVRLDVRTGAVRATFDVVPDGCVGGAVSSSPALDTTAGLLYVGTGNNEFSCEEPLATSVVALRLDDLSVVDSWQPPPGELTLDGDFLAAPTLFPATVDGTTRHLVGIPNKNGTFYAFRADALASGPVWRAAIARPATCACNGAAISPAAFDGTSLYVAGGATTNPDGSSCGGTLQALDPGTGASRWRRCLPAAVLGAVTVVSDVVVVGSGPELRLVAATDGHDLLTYAPGLGNFWAPVAVAGATVLAPNMNGNLLALSLPPAG